MSAEGSRQLKKKMSNKNKIKVRVEAFDKNNKQDVKNAKILTKLFSDAHEDYREIIDALIVARASILALYQVRTPNIIWEKILEKVIARDIRKLKEQ